MYNLTSEEVFSEVKSSRNGLSTQEAKNRLLENGKNEIKFTKKRSLAEKLKYQLNNIVMYVLLFACVANIVAVIINKDVLQVVNILLIFAVMVLNVVIGLVQMNKMEKTLINVEKLITPTSKVKRNDRVITVDTSDLVVGDIVYLRAGDIVPADLRLIDTSNLFISDVLITGQTMSVEKTCTVIDGKYMPLGDRTNMAYMGSSVTAGSGVGIVVATGKDTEIGKTTVLMSEEIKLETPVLRSLNRTVTIMSFVVLVFSALAFVLNIVRHNDISASFMVAVSLAVCVVPESLVISIFATLSQSVKRLAKANLLVKDLGLIEQLGAVQVLCVDKTKVLTINKKTVKDVWVNNMEEYELKNNPNFMTMINCMLLCNNCTSEISVDGDFVLTGGGSEKALAEYAYGMGFNIDSVKGIFPQVNEIPFDRYRKRMSTLNSVGEFTYGFTKGNFEQILNNCNYILFDGQQINLTKEKKKELLKKNEEYIADGYSVMAFATKLIKGNVYEVTENMVEQDMTFVGLCAIYDPTKQDTEDAIKECKALGVKLCMLTSDNKETALMVAKNLNIATNEKQVVTGQELDMMTDVELYKRIDSFTVFSKLLNGQKLRIVKALQSKYIVATTGDNVEDMPAIKQANVGIGLGQSGCDMVKQSSGLVTTADGLGTITKSVKESRRVHFNILKMMEYLLGTGIAQLILISLLVVVLDKAFFSPALILWLNFVNGLLPCMGVGNEKVEKETITKPVSSKISIVNRISGINTILFGIIQAFIVIMMYFAGEIYGLDYEVIITMCFITLAFLEIFHAFNMKHETKSLFSSNPFNNAKLNLGLIVSMLVTVLFVGLPLSTLHLSLGVTAISFGQWSICFGVGLLIIPIAEAIKIVERMILEKK